MVGDVEHLTGVTDTTVKVNALYHFLFAFDYRSQKQLMSLRADRKGRVGRRRMLNGDSVKGKGHVQSDCPPLFLSPQRTIGTVINKLYPFVRVIKNFVLIKLCVSFVLTSQLLCAEQ